MDTRRPWLAGCPGLTDSGGFPRSMAIWGDRYLVESEVFQTLTKKGAGWWSLIVAGCFVLDPFPKTHSTNALLVCILGKRELLSRTNFPLIFQGACHYSNQSDDDDKTAMEMSFLSFSLGGKFFSPRGRRFPFLIFRDLSGASVSSLSEVLET